VDAPQMRLQETAGVPPPTSTLEPLPRRYLLTRQIGLVLMIGSSIAALFVLGASFRSTWHARRSGLAQRTPRCQAFIRRRRRARKPWLVGTEPSP
jgi:hypothetical protein